MQHAHEEDDIDENTKEGTRMVFMAAWLGGGAASGSEDKALGVRSRQPCKRQRLSHLSAEKKRLRRRSLLVVMAWRRP
ncbi:unnamed protein product [Lampetra planeri]